ncbi:hypothetical protein BGZ60DRAFT_235321 [Tricladium varicosporioides]|nr:hypothetical protein BGZ60DRAFT_235321 [Hymenoscyphus varicosporioides]
MLRDHARKYAPWRLVYIVPIWCLELFLMPILVVGLVFIVVITRESPGTVTDKAGNKFPVSPGVPIWVIINLIAASTALVLTCMEMIMLNMRDLSPGIFCGFSIVKFVMWLVPIALNLYTFSTKWSVELVNKIMLGVALGFDLALLIPLSLSLVYAFVVFKRFRNRANGYLETHLNDEAAYRQKLTTGVYG